MVSRQLELNLEASRPSEEEKTEPELPASGRDAALEQEARELLLSIDLGKVADLLEVHWNRRMRSSAGRAYFPAWKIELNPRIAEFEGETARTLRHELAHLVAYSRSGRKRIQPHGAEWRQACVDLGIPGEKACHTLPLPVRRQERKYRYACPECSEEISRARPLKKPAACWPCCRKHAGGGYKARFRLVRVS